MEGFWIKKKKNWNCEMSSKKYKSAESAKYFTLKETHFPLSNVKITFKLLSGILFANT